jgi:hypothetical protein
MKSYAEKKESVCLFKTDRKEQGNSRFIRREAGHESGKSTGSAFSMFLKEFRGEAVNSDKMILFSVENGLL